MGDICHPGITTNVPELSALRAEINTLYQLGMKEIDTVMLDSALMEAHQYAKDQQERAAAQTHHKDLWRTLPF